jgi:hypothetical protein
MLAVDNHVLIISICSQVEFWMDYLRPSRKKRLYGRSRQKRVMRNSQTWLLPLQDHYEVGVVECGKYLSRSFCDFPKIPKFKRVLKPCILAFDSCIGICIQTGRSGGCEAYAHPPLLAEGVRGTSASGLEIGQGCGRSPRLRSFRDLNRRVTLVRLCTLCSVHSSAWTQGWV